MSAGLWAKEFQNPKWQLGFSQVIDLNDPLSTLALSCERLSIFASKFQLMTPANVSKLQSGMEWH